MGKTYSSFEKGNVIELTEVSKTYTHSLAKGKGPMSMDNKAAGIRRNFVEMDVGLAPFAPFSQQFMLTEEATGPNSSMVLPKESATVTTPPWHSHAVGNEAGRRNTYANIVENGNIDLPKTMAAGDGMSRLQAAGTLFGMKLRDIGVSGWRRKTQASFGAHAEVITENIALDMFDELKQTDAQFNHDVTKDRYNINIGSKEDYSRHLLNEGLDFGIKTETERIKQQVIFGALEKAGFSKETLRQTMGGEETVAGTKNVYEGKAGKLLQQITTSNMKPDQTIDEGFETAAQTYVTRMNKSLSMVKSNAKKAGLDIQTIGDLIGKGDQGSKSLLTASFKEGTSLYDIAINMGGKVKQDKKGNKTAKMFTKDVPFDNALASVLFNTKHKQELNRFLRRSFDTPILQSLSTKYQGKDIMIEQVPLSHKRQGTSEIQLAQGFAAIRLKGASSLATLTFELVDTVVSRQTEDFGMDMWLLEQYGAQRLQMDADEQKSAAYNTLKNVYFPLLQREYLVSEYGPEAIQAFMEPGGAVNATMEARVARLMTEKQIAESLKRQMMDGARMGDTQKIVALYQEMIKESEDLSELWRQASSSLTGWKGDIDRYNFDEDPQSGLKYHAGLWFPGQYWVNDTGFGNAISPFMGVAYGAEAGSAGFYQRFQDKVMDR
jgi:hypothetical protein